MKEVLNTKELCEYLSISKSTLWRYLKNGKLPQPTKLGAHLFLWKKSQIDEALELNKP